MSDITVSGLVTTLENSLKNSGSTVVGAIVSFFSSSLVTLAEDEVIILGNALNVVLTDLRAGKGWEETVTAALNEFYNEELNEGSKIATAFLEAIAKVVSVVQAL